MIVYVGSTRPAKVEGTRDALAALAGVEPRFGAAILTPIDVTDAAPRMPMSENAIIEGAAARAGALIERQNSAAASDPERFYIGLEGGLDPVRSGHRTLAFALKSWACVTDGRRWSYGGGGAVMLPAMLADEVGRGRELGDVVDTIVGSPVRGMRGAWGVLTRDVVTRRDSFRLAVINAFAPFVNPGLYFNQSSVDL